MLSRGMSTRPTELLLLRANATPRNSEVFVIVSLTLFLPICLEQFARDNGYFAPDRTQPCSTIKPIPLRGNSTATTPLQTLADSERCEVKIGWVWIDTASFRCVCVLFASLCFVLRLNIVSTSTRYRLLFKR